MSIGLAFVLAEMCSAATNLVLNGGFEKGEKHPDQWFVKLTDFFDKKQGGDPPTHRYLCACGKDLGDIMPYCGLICPQCKGFLCGQESGGWYTRNHERVSFDAGPRGRCLKFTLPKDVGENQGVRVFSTLIPAKRGWGYIFEFDARTSGALARAWVEGYRNAPGPKTFAWDGDYTPNTPKVPIEWCYRSPVNCGSVQSWKHFATEVHAPRSYQFDYLIVKLYAYMPGEAWFDNVSLRPMTERELQDFVASHTPKDKRFTRK